MSGKAVDMTAMLEVAEAPPGFELAYRHHLDDVQWGRITRRIAKKHGHSLELAERILNQTIAFLLLCGENQDSLEDADEPGLYSPSELVDHGWHIFMEYQRELEDFCLRNFGRMVYHSPNDVPGVDYSVQRGPSTVQALRDRSYAVDEALWLNSGNCEPCHSDYSGCSSG